MNIEIERNLGEQPIARIMVDLTLAARVKGQLATFALVHLSAAL